MAAITGCINHSKFTESPVLSECFCVCLCVLSLVAAVEGHAQRPQEADRHGDGSD